MAQIAFSATQDQLRAAWDRHDREGVYVALRRIRRLQPDLYREIRQILLTKGMPPELANPLP